MKRMVLFAAIFVILAAGAWVRLAPTDTALWHTDPVTSAAADCTVLPGTGGARAACTVPGAPGEVLARLDAIALATPRTHRMAGSAEEGRITWVTRSLIWGFPDYTTAAAAPLPEGTRLDVHARLRFGGSDLGVNAARLEDWLSRLMP